jgi:hypothetical protein
METITQGEDKRVGLLFCKSDVASLLLRAMIGLVFIGHRQLGGAGCGWDDRLGCSGRGGAGVGGGWRAVACGVPLSYGDHQPWCVAVLPLPAELPRGRRADAPARDRGLPRNGAAVVCQVRADLRQRATTPAAPPW